MDSNNFDRLSRSLASTSSRRQALKLFGGGLVGGVVAAKGLNAATAQRTQGTGIPVVGTLDDGAFEGTLSDLSAVVDRTAGVINISGTVTGVSEVLGAITDTFTATLENLTASEESCQILFLELGPLFLDLLGLQIDLSQITLDITAVPGAGNLLGNLLCAVAGLLDNPSGNLNGIANLLNRIFRILG